MVGTGRFELPTPRTPSECSTRLSHVPTLSSQLMKSRLLGSYLVYIMQALSACTRIENCPQMVSALAPVDPWPLTPDPSFSMCWRNELLGQSRALAEEKLLHLLH